MFWRFEDLWQSPTGDISHAVKLPVDRTLRPPEIPVYRQARCRGGGYAIETATYTPTVTSVVVASQLDGEWIDEQRSDPAFVASLAPGWRCRRRRPSAAIAVLHGRLPTAKLSTESDTPWSAITASRNPAWKLGRAARLGVGLQYGRS